VDNLTHSLVGWTLARAGVGRGVPYATATLVLASNAPDLDIVVALAGGVEYLAAHRGPTHGPLGVIGLGLATAAGMAAWTRWRARGPGTGSSDTARRSLARWFRLTAIGVIGHALMDLPTAYGTRLFSPFGWAWYALDWMPIIDVYLWVVLGAALVLGRATGRPAGAARIALALMAIDYAARGALHQRALANGAEFDASGSRVPCAAAPTLVVHPATLETPPGPDECLAAAALPTFVSPFTWRIVRRSATGYELSDRDLFRQAASIRSVRLTSDTGPEIAGARGTRAGLVYLDFARFPLARIAAQSPTTTVRLFDARFIGLPTDTHTAALPTHLSVAITLDGSGRTLDQRMGR
jgi:LexA-binding, inner membrane-associated putative hydrolase